MTLWSWHIFSRGITLYCGVAGVKTHACYLRYVRIHRRIAVLLYIKLHNLVLLNFMQIDQRLLAITKALYPCIFFQPFVETRKTQTKSKSRVVVEVICLVILVDDQSLESNVQL